MVTGVGIEVRIDDAELDALGELRCLVAGGTTYTRHASGEVHRRTATTIRTQPAGTHPRQTVHALHVCPTLDTPGA